MPCPDPDAASRIAAIASRLASPFDGEVVNAARLLTRELAKNGMLLERVIALGLASQGSPDVREAQNDEAAPAHQREAAEILQSKKGLTFREAMFLRTMCSAHTCTPAQRDWLNGLLRRHRTGSKAA